MKYAIQWYDQFGKRDGNPRGKFNSKEEAEKRAEAAVEECGAFDLCYEIVEREYTGESLVSSPDFIPERRRL
jgi:hypothetical protein